MLTRIFIQFDQDRSNSLEISELVNMLVENYISPAIDEKALENEPWELQDFVR